MERGSYRMSRSCLDGVLITLTIRLLSQYLKGFIIRQMLEYAVKCGGQPRSQRGCLSMIEFDPDGIFL